MKSRQLNCRALVLISFALGVPIASGFCIGRSLHTCRDDVLTAVSRAEQLWADALDARETANALSDRAEEEAEAAMELTENVAALYKSMKSISLEKIAKADAATTSSIDANGMVGRALEACQKADLLELQAEEALLLSEEKLTQHLLDFPDSSLAE